MGTDYPLYNSVVLNNATSIYIINNQSRFVNKLWLSKGIVYTGIVIVPIKGIETAAIMI